MDDVLLTVLYLLLKGTLLKPNERFKISNFSLLASWSDFSHSKVLFHMLSRYMLSEI